MADQPFGPPASFRQGNVDRVQQNQGSCRPDPFYQAVRLEKSMHTWAWIFVLVCFWSCATRCNQQRCMKLSLSLLHLRSLQSITDRMWEVSQVVDYPRKSPLNFGPKVDSKVGRSMVENTPKKTALESLSSDFYLVNIGNDLL